MLRKFASITSIVLATSLSGINTASADGLTIEVLQSLSRVGAPVVSPDGQKVAYTVREANLQENSAQTDIFVLESTGGAEPLQLTDSPKSDSEPQWGPDNDTLYFLSSRSGSNQIWRKSISGGRTQQVTDFPIDLATFRLSPDGSRIVFAASVFPDCDTLQCTADRLSEIKNNPETGTLYDGLFVRHWDRFKDGRVSVLHAAPLENGVVDDGEPTRLIGEIVGDVPGIPFGGRDAFVFSPDGETIFFSMRETGPLEPRSTDFDIYSVPAAGGVEPVLLTDGMDGNDGSPIVSPDGETLAFVSMTRAGYESDQTNLILMRLSDGEKRNLTEGFDRSIGEPSFTPDGQDVIVTAGDVGTHPIFRISITDGDVTKLTTGFNATSPAIAGSDIVFVERALNRPADLFSIPLDGGEKRRLTDVNSDALKDIEMGAYEQFEFKGAKGDAVYGYAMKPAGFEEGKEYPVAFIIHGGPQGSYSEGWSYRWNPQVYAGAGYGVVFIDFHGSTGYGQAFTDSINGDWGGKPWSILNWV